MSPYPYHLSGELLLVFFLLFLRPILLAFSNIFAVSFAFGLLLWRSVWYHQLMVKSRSSDWVVIFKRIPTFARSVVGLFHNPIDSQTEEEPVITQLYFSPVLTLSDLIQLLGRQPSRAQPWCYLRTPPASPSVFGRCDPILLLHWLFCTDVFDDWC